MNPNKNANIIINSQLSLKMSVITLILEIKLNVVGEIRQANKMEMTQFVISMISLKTPLKYAKIDESRINPTAKKSNEVYKSISIFLKSTQKIL